MTHPAGRDTALVTGTSSGIGAAYAERLAREGYDLILVARRGERLEAQARRLRAQCGIEAEPLAADLTDAADLARVERRIESEPRLALLVNNAGRGDLVAFTDMPRELVANMIALNVVAVTRLAHAALPGMLARGGGTIVNVSSGLAYGVNPPFSVYGASKAFVSHFTELLHEEVGSKGIRLQALAPGLTRTNLGNAEANGLFAQFPPEMVMSPEDLVDASWRSLGMGELFCFPLLADPAAWERAHAAVKAIGDSPLSNRPAARYRPGSAQ